MTNREIERDLEKQGFKITKDKIANALKKTTDKEFWFKQDQTSTYAIVRIRID
jgi:hypothetical protein